MTSRRRLFFARVRSTNVHSLRLTSPSCSVKIVVLRHILKLLNIVIRCVVAYTSLQRDLAENAMQNLRHESCHEAMHEAHDTSGINLKVVR